MLTFSSIKSPLRTHRCGFDDNFDKEVLNMGARRRRLNKQIVFGEETDGELDPFQQETKGTPQKYRDTHASSGTTLGVILSIIAFLAVAGWAFLMVVHSSISR